MCGIAGIVVPPGEAACPGTLAAMGAALTHRGPDDGRSATYGRAGFAFRRLSIIDVAGGAQPIDNEDASCHIVLNGEIYNHLELRQDLERRGHRFQTSSDVECVVHGYEEFGKAVVAKLRGMFAFALWDEKEQRLLLARDRLGKKPLVYHEAGGRLSFASEFQGLLKDPRVPRAPDLLGIHHYLTYQYVPAPLTGFEGVSKLLPGHLLIFENGRSRIERYWSLSARPTLEIDEQEAAAEVRRLLRDAVKVRLMSEVPLGAFLSGGLDSSAVVALMAEFGPVKTFSVGFEETGFSELPYARQVAQRYGTDHHEFMVRPRAADDLPRLVEHYGEPYGDSSALPTYYLSRETAAHVKVALNGDGGDELFAGYDRYKLLAAYAALGRIPGSSPVCEAVRRLCGGRLPVRIDRFLRAASASPEESYGRIVSYFSPEQKDDLYAPEMKRQVASDSFQFLYRAYADSDAPDLLGRTLFVDLMTYLPGDLLVKVDIASMAHGLEGRSPLLDHPLVEFVARLPSRLKLRGVSGKYILRRAVSDLLPGDVMRRRKMGFGVPVSLWFRTELQEMLRDTLLSSHALERPFFQESRVRRLVEEHVSGRRDHGPKLWALLMLELWSRRFLDGPAA